MADAVASVDLPPLAVAFARELRLAGVPVTTGRVERFARGIALVKPDRVDDLYWVARSTLLQDRTHLAAFDAAFAVIFGGKGDRFAGSRQERSGEPDTTDLRPGHPEETDVPDAPEVEGTPSGDLPAPGVGGQAGSSQDGETREVILAAASDEERLGTRSFADLDADELRRVRELMRQFAISTPTRITRRRRRSPRGERLDLRATIRRSLHTGGDPVFQARRRRIEHHRQLVVICDISGSMEPYARALLQFVQSAAVGGHAEVFVFATRLTRLTRALRSTRPDEAIRRAAALAPDWSGGTRIGEALKRFNDRYGRRGLARGAVVVILSDGWERSDPELVGRETERLARLAHRIVWVNPRAGSRGFEPLAGGMAAALPHVDTLLAGDTLDRLGEVVEAIAERGHR